MNVCVCVCERNCACDPFEPLRCGRDEAETEKVVCYRPKNETGVIRLGGAV